MIPTVYNLPDAYRGDSYGPITFLFTDVNGNNINLSGVSAASQVRSKKNELVLQWLTSDGSIRISGNSLTFNAVSGAKMKIPAATYNYDLQIVSGQSTNTYLKGEWTIYKDVTEL